jgi:IS30 family transposase
MNLLERMDIFKLLYVERLKPSAIAVSLNRSPSSIARELEKGMDNGMYNPIIAEARHLEARRNQCPRLKMTDEAWKAVKPQLEKRSFFCKPYHSWEKGGIENRNGILRRYFPKKHNWRLTTQKSIDKVASKINATPMKCLGFKTPAEVFAICAGVALAS